MIAERSGDLDEGLVSSDRGAVQEKIETEPKIAVVSRVVRIGGAHSCFHFQLDATSFVGYILVYGKT